MGPKQQKTKGQAVVSTAVVPVAQGNPPPPPPPPVAAGPPAAALPAATTKVKIYIDADTKPDDRYKITSEYTLRRLEEIFLNRNPGTRVYGMYPGRWDKDIKDGKIDHLATPKDGGIEREIGTYDNVLILSDLDKLNDSVMTLYNLFRNDQTLRENIGSKPDLSPPIPLSYIESTDKYPDYAEEQLYIGWVSAFNNVLQEHKFTYHDGNTVSMLNKSNGNIATDATNVNTLILVPRDYNFATACTSLKYKLVELYPNGYGNNMNSNLKDCLGGIFKFKSGQYSALTRFYRSCIYIYTYIAANGSVQCFCGIEELRKFLDGMDIQLMYFILNDKASSYKSVAQERFIKSNGEMPFFQQPIDNLGNQQKPLPPYEIEMKKEKINDTEKNGLTKDIIDELNEHAKKSVNTFEKIPKITDHSLYEKVDYALKKMFDLGELHKINEVCANSSTCLDQLVALLNGYLADPYTDKELDQLLAKKIEELDTIIAASNASRNKFSDDEFESIDNITGDTTMDPDDKLEILKEYLSKIANPITREKVRILKRYNPDIISDLTSIDKADETLNTYLTHNNQLIAQEIADIKLKYSDIAFTKYWKYISVYGSKPDSLSDLINLKLHFSWLIDPTALDTDADTLDKAINKINTTLKTITKGGGNLTRKNKKEHQSNKSLKFRYPVSTRLKNI